MLPRAALDVEVALDVVRPICEDVRLRGAAAVREWSHRLDGVDAETTRVPAEALAAALDALDPAVRAALEEAARRARAVHEAQRRARTPTSRCRRAAGSPRSGCRYAGSGSTSPAAWWPTRRRS